MVGIFSQSQGGKWVGPKWKRSNNLREQNIKIKKICFEHEFRFCEKDVYITSFDNF